MTKLFKCPECRKPIHTLVSYYENSTQYNALNIDKDENIYITDTTIETPNKIQYSCPHCHHHSHNKHDFIAEIECDCECFNTSTEHTDDEFRIDICQHCGLVTQVEYIGDEY